MMITKWRSGIPAFAACLLLLGCVSLTPKFDDVALEQAISIKADALALMAAATEPFSEHQTETTDLKGKVDDAVRYAKNRAKAKDSAKQWELIQNPKGNLLGGFLTRWESEGQLGPAFVVEASDLVAEGFDKIIELEEARRP